MWLTSTFVFVLPGAGALGALIVLAQGRVSAIHVTLFVVGFVLSGLGVTIGYHRLLTHRSFETHVLVKALLLIFGSMAVEGPAVEWAANHLKHHAHSDRQGDPHSPSEGFVHSHWGWLFRFSAVEVERYGGAVLQDRVARRISDTFIIWAIVGYVVPFLIGGWEGLLWGGALRQFAVQNVTFAVNSVCHRWGSRPFKTSDLSRNNWVVGLLGLGEGWHNNHHAFPASAFHGLRWWEIDLSAQVIRCLAAMRLAWNVRRPDVEQIQRKLFEPAALTSHRRVIG